MVITPIINDGRINRSKTTLNKIVAATISLLRKNKDLENAIKKFEKYQYDSLFSGVNLHSMIWKLSKNKIRPLNFNIKKRSVQVRFFGHRIEETF